MIKIVIYDSGYGGEIFADQLESELPTANIIRVIDWRNADQINHSARTARNCAETALRPYIGNVDLIVLANHLLSFTSLGYFRKRHKTQKIIGMNFGLKATSILPPRQALILTTTPTTRTLKFHKMIFNLKCPTNFIRLDSWPRLIDDGELTKEKIKYDINGRLVHNNFKPTDVILACTHLADAKADIKSALGGRVKIHDGFNETIRDVHRILKIRGGPKKKK